MTTAFSFDDLRSKIATASDMGAAGHFVVLTVSEARDLVDAWDLFNDPAPFDIGGRNPDGGEDVT
jgi:hypothetical protein